MLLVMILRNVVCIHIIIYMVKYVNIFSTIYL